MQIQRVNNQQNQNFGARISFKKITNVGERPIKQLSSREKLQLRKKAARIGKSSDRIRVWMNTQITTSPFPVGRGPKFETETAEMSIDTVIAGVTSEQKLPRIRTVEEGKSELAKSSPFSTISKYLDALRREQKLKQKVVEAEVK